VHRGEIELKKARAFVRSAIPLMLTCQEFDAFLVDYFDGKLSGRQRRKFDLHLRLCSDCRRYVKGYKQTIALSRVAFVRPDGEVPEEVPEELVTAILALRGHPE